MSIAICFFISTPESFCKIKFTYNEYNVDQKDTLLQVSVFSFINITYRLNSVIIQKNIPEIITNIGTQHLAILSYTLNVFHSNESTAVQSQLEPAICNSIIKKLQVSLINQIELIFFCFNLFLHTLRTIILFTCLPFSIINSFCL